MKKLSFLAIILIATCTFAMAQPRAIGGRIGSSIGPSYQHQIGEKNMIQADLDFLFYGLWGVQGTVTFNWLVPLVNVNAGQLNLYPGVGVGGGYEWWNWGGWRGGPLYNGGYGTGFVGVAGMIGLEWCFKFPLQLSFEYRPLIGVELLKYWDKKSINASFYYNGLWSSAIAVGVRYKFGGK
jgi:hypothetical protein